MDNVPENFNHVLDFPADEYKRLKTTATDYYVFFIFSNFFLCGII